MNNEDLQNIINGFGTDLEFSTEASEFLNVIVSKEQLHSVCSQLKSNPELNFNYAFCITGMDWGKELGVIYHLESTELKHQLVVKVMVEDRENPVLDSVHDIWQTADFHELEIFDFFGIKFNNHPKLRRLFLTPDWDGFPLRKDYVDEANMIVK
ncbi:MAG: NADH-quinone oxidoreductase chain 5 [Flavobacteriaceae bacterium]|nr:MAG: NADH-quinone oxidoreductase chain 5 [Flavobacteriaceae bacterium]